MMTGPDNLVLADVCFGRSQAISHCRKTTDEKPLSKPPLVSAGNDKPLQTG